MAESNAMIENNRFVERKLSKSRAKYSFEMTGLFVVFVMVLSTILGYAGFASASTDSEGESGIVNVTIGADGTIKGISTGNSDMDSLTESELAEVVADLPVRILVSYTDSSGATKTNLEELNGASGLVRIDLEIQNTTGVVEGISADVNGGSVTQHTMVYTPLTVIGTAELESVESGQIILDDSDDSDDGSAADASDSSDNSASTASDEESTNEDSGDSSETSDLGGSNGVVSSLDQGTTVMQWASILAPPYLSSSTTFTLVVDADDFQVPDFNIAVQAGYRISDTSVGTGTSSSDQVELVANTLYALSSVGEVFSSAGTALDNAYALLSNAGESIGTQTISDLNSAHSSILLQAETLSTTLDSLSVSFDQLMETTGLEIVSELSQATSTVSELLGNPDYLSPDYTVDSVTCEMSVTKNSDSDYSNGVMGVVYDLSSRLDAYAGAAENCHSALVDQLTAYIGSPESVDTCSSDGEESASLTCQLLSAKQGMTGLNEKLDDDYSEYVGIASELDELKESLGNSLQTLESSLASIEIEMVGISIQGVKEKLDELSGELDRLTGESVLTSLEEAKSTASSAVDNLSSQLETITGADGIVSQIKTYEETVTKVEAKICDFDLEDVSVEEVSEDSAEALLAELQKTLSCNSGDESSISAADGAEATSTPLSNSLKAELEGIGGYASDAGTAVGEIIDAVDDITGVVDEYLGESGSVTQSLATIKEAISQAASSSEDTDEKLSQIQCVFKGLTATEESLSEIAGLLSKRNDSLRDNLESLKLQNESNYDTTLEQADYTLAALEGTSLEFFTDLSGQLTTSADEIQTTGILSLTNTQQVVEETNQNLGDETVATLEENSVYVTDRLSSASADATSVSDLLAEDIQKVLADIGENTLGGGGLLGAIASANGQLLMAGANMGESSMQVVDYQNEQRALLSDYLLSAAVLKTSLARLEQGTDNSWDSTMLISSYSYHLVEANTKE